ncbi:MAG: hypothetical protein SGI84_10235 [Gemmatimonadota bacterium]|nr:hypothetical protein [Gemmatimonadota bacterium]
MRRLTSLLAALILACSAGAQTDPAPNLQIVPPGEVTLLQGQTAEVALPGAPSALFIKFERIVTDSRCPSNVQCVWAGEVAVLLTLTGQSTGELTLRIPASNAGSSTGDAGPYRVELKAVTPYPAAGTTPTEPNRVTVSISPKP